MGEERSTGVITMRYDNTSLDNMGAGTYGVCIEPAAIDAMISWEATGEEQNNPLAQPDGVQA